MADWLLLRLPPQPEAEASWMVVDPAGRAVIPPQTGALAQAVSLATGRRVCVVVPGTDVLLTAADLPAKAAGAKLQQIVAYALEEQVAQDIEELHFAVGRRTEGTRTPVAVVSRALLDEWLATVRAAGLEPEAMYADSNLLPANPGQAVAMLERDAIVVRPIGGMPLTLPAEALAEAFELVQPSGDQIVAEQRSARGLILYTGPAEWQRWSRDVEAARDRFDGIKVQLLTSGPLAMLAPQAVAGTAINLLQGAYEPKSVRATGWRAWRVAAILLAALFVLHVAGRAAELAMLERTERELDAAIAATFRSAMPGEQSTVDARRRMEQRLLVAREGAAAGGLLDALSALVEARASAPGTVVQALSYRGGALDLKVSAPSADSLERISQSLRAGGWQADLTSGNVAGSRYEGRIQIKPRST